MGPDELGAGQVLLLDGEREVGDVQDIVHADPIRMYMSMRSTLLR